MKEFSNYLVRPNACLRDVIEVINRGAAQIALVTDSEQKLLGTITDGDIRRAMLRNVSLMCLADRVMCRDFSYLSSTATEEDAMALMRHKTLHQIPALDDQGRVVQLFLLEELIKPKKRQNPVVIMAGGKGKRLGPLTKNCPKPMLPVGGKPMLEIILEQCIDAGFQNFYLSVNYLKEQIQDYFGDGTRWHVNIDYLEEKQPLGTGGALSLLPKKFSEPVLVINGDVLTRIDYGQFLRFQEEEQTAASVCVCAHETKIPYGVVRIDKSLVLALEEKPVINHYVNAGIYLVDQVLLDLVPHDQFFDMPDLLKKAIDLQYQVSAFPVHEYWLDVGYPISFERANNEWL